ncbi:unnamed protein product [Rotaria sordida]|uniref:ubiquitinyl hydrolase 1 n=1 Tax=Rotaria sordida TaxID=392033 RepID=A0A814ZBQ6_9BILA|nr:unnamed protein product [Rotaria sordida]
MTSREYSDMYVDEDQRLGTLIGLKSGLLLSPLTVINQTNRNYLCRKLIVPFGQVHATKKSDSDHQIVMIDRKSSSASMLHQYFVFILNDRLRILQPTDSPTGWLYLALLHAMTSHPLPDQYMGMTGMERSFQLLHSAGCWSDQPYDSITRNILLQIATISPKVNFYPEHLTLKKLVETSEEWNFMHPSSTSNDEIEKLFQNKKYNEKLLAKLYWDYRDSYNPTARLSVQMEKEICGTSSTKSYQPVWESCSYSTNYSPLRLVDHLYSSGDVNLKDSEDLRCFPLSRWLKDEYQLKNIWIGLFKFAEQLNTVESDHRKDDIERFEMLLDFLHYISVPLNVKVLVNPQYFAFELFENHFQISLNSKDKCIDQKLLENAKQKFLHPHSNYFIKPKICVPIINEQKEFPQEIFPSIDSQVNPLSDITNYFKEHLTKSWKKFNLTEEYENEFPSMEEINQFLDSFHQESIQLWDELVNSITITNDLLVKMGLVLRILPTTLISVFQQMWLNDNESNILFLHLTLEQRTLLGGIIVNWIVEQQLERALNFADQAKWEDFEKEILNIPHTNWTPSEYVPWLILELEMNITIREIQAQVARHMIQPILNENNSSVRNIVMQMNMGEGKTSVILPMLALSLCSSSLSLVRIVVLKALFPMNYQSLRYKLGGLLNRHVISFACRRDMNFNYAQVNKIFDRLKQGLHNLDIVLTSPEDILSFDLLTIDKCRRNEFDAGRSMLSIQSWMKTFVRDVLDESDEILHVKYQLIYSIGRQQQVDGGMERWKTIQYVLNLVKQHAANIAQQYNDDVFYKAAERQSSFPEFRLLNHRPFLELCRRIASDWINQKSYRQLDQQFILSFILDTNSSNNGLVDQFPHNTTQLFLIMRGLLSSEVLFVGLKKRF